MMTIKIKCLPSTLICLIIHYPSQAGYNFIGCVYNIINNPYKKVTVSVCVCVCNEGSSKLLHC